MIEQRTALSGRNNRETAILYNSLAITLTQANQLEAALQAYRDTLDIYRAMGMGDQLDAQIVLGNVGTLDLRTGRIKEAETQLKSAFEHQRALAGDSAAVAAAMGYYGRALYMQNRNREAVDALREAADLATRYAGATSPVALQNRLFLGEAQLATGDVTSAARTFKAAHDEAVAQHGDAHPLALRAQIALARLAIATGHESEARATLGPVIDTLRKLGAQTQPYLAEALGLLGSAELSRGQTQPAIESLREAVAIRERASPQSWELAQARQRLSEAMTTAANPPASGQAKASRPAP